MIFIYIYPYYKGPVINYCEGGGLQIQGGGSEVLPLPGTYTHRRPCPYKKIKGGGEGECSHTEGRT